MKRTVRLYGVLRKHFGRDFALQLSSPAEGINALCYLLPGFERFLRNAVESTFDFIEAQRAFTERCQYQYGPFVRDLIEQYPAGAISGVDDWRVLVLPQRLNSFFLHVVSSGIPEHF